MDNETENSYVIRPTFEKKFRPAVIQDIMSQVVKQVLGDKQYDTDAALGWSQDICDEVRQHVKDLQLDRYKIVVQATIGEQRGGGAKMATRCFWDSDTDNCAEHVYVNDSLFCVAVTYGVYFY